MGSFAAARAIRPMVERVMGRPGVEGVPQSLRCYEPAELCSLLEGTGLELVDILPGVVVDRRLGEYRNPVSLEAAMNYLATLRHPGRLAP